MLSPCDCPICRMMFDATTCTQSELDQFIFNGEPTYKPIGLRDKLTDEQISVLCSRSTDFDTATRDWLYATLAVIIDEQLAD